MLNPPFPFPWYIVSPNISLPALVSVRGGVSEDLSSLEWRNG